MPTSNNALRYTGKAANEKITNTPFWIYREALNLNMYTELYGPKHKDAVAVATSLGTRAIDGRIAKHSALSWL
jgi:hypothetical protein